MSQDSNIQIISLILRVMITIHFAHMKNGQSNLEKQTVTTFKLTKIKHSTEILVN